METKASTLELESIWGKSMNDDSGVIHTWVVSQNLVYLKETNNNIQYIYNIDAYLYVCNCVMYISNLIYFKCGYIDVYEHICFFSCFRLGADKRAKMQQNRRIGQLDGWTNPSSCGELSQIHLSHVRSISIFLFEKWASILVQIPKMLILLKGVAMQHREGLLININYKYPADFLARKKLV